MTLSGEAVALIIGGLSSFVGIAFAGWAKIRDGADSRRGKLMKDIEEARDRAEHNQRQEAELRRYWEGYVRRVVALCVRQGVEPPDVDPPEWVSFEDRDEAKKR